MFDKALNSFMTDWFLYDRNLCHERVNSYLNVHYAINLFVLTR